jgi:hypothetical protein
LTAIWARRRLALEDFEKRLRPVVAYIRPLPLKKLIRKPPRNQTANQGDQFETCETPMNEAVFLHGARDVRVAPINLRDGRPGETLIEVAAVGNGSTVVHDPFRLA